MRFDGFPKPFKFIGYYVKLAEMILVISFHTIILTFDLFSLGASIRNNQQIKINFMDIYCTVDKHLRELKWTDYTEDMSSILKVRWKKYLYFKRIKFTIYMFPIQSSTYLYI